MSNLFLYAANSGGIAKASNSATNAATSILGTVATVGAALMAIFLIYSIVKDGISYAKGSNSGSLYGIIGKVVVMALMLGVIFLVQNGYRELGNQGKDIVDKGLGAIKNVTDDVIDDNGLTGAGDVK